MSDSEKKCFHCQNNLETSSIILRDDKLFCCRGCETVYSILLDSKLTDYYQHKDSNLFNRPEEGSDKFSFLDQSDFQLEYYQKNDQGHSFRFYIEGIHCTACLWLLEKLSQLGVGVISSKLNMSESILTVIFSKEAKLSLIAQKIQALGYKPHPILDGEEHLNLARKENKESLIRIGVAFACAGNIMLYSFSVYLGAPQSFASYFNLFSFLCTIPIVFYCSIPFYKTALASFTTKVISIDLPIVVVIVLSFILGAISLIYPLEVFYFDTISMLVFLLLSSRYLLKVIQRKALSMDNISHTYLNQTAIRISDEEEHVMAKYLNVGDLVKVMPQASVPADGIIVKGESYFNNSILTGESLPINAKEGDSVFMGALNSDQEVLIRITTKTSESKMGKILAQIEAGWNNKNSIMSFVDKITQYFSVVLISLASLFFFYFNYTYNLQIAFERTFALLLITCPCALALSTPLAMILGLSSFLRKGIYIKDEKTLEKITKVKNVYLDKTGTLTDGVFSLDFDGLEKEDLEIIYSLEKRSSHPIARSIVREIEKHSEISSYPVELFKEIPGVGVSGQIEGKDYSLKSSVISDTNENQICLWENDKIKTSFCVEDNLRPEAKIMIHFLKECKLNIFILSGDKKNRVLKSALKLGLQPENCMYEQDPEGKCSIIEKSHYAMMAGDGVNDSLSIQRAYVGVAVKGSAQSSLKASDIFISRPGIELIVSLFKGSKEVFMIIRRNLGFSLIYNLLGVYLAFIGAVSPLLAAIFMPLSSLTVLFSTIFSAKKIRDL